MRGGDLKRAVSTIRWRLAIGLASLAAAVVLTVPAGAAGQFGRQVGEIWPNSLAAVADVIWPNGPDFVGDSIWPNLVQVSDLINQALD